MFAGQRQRLTFQLYPSAVCRVRTGKFHCLVRWIDVPVHAATLNAYLMQPRSEIQMDGENLQRLSISSMGSDAKIGDCRYMWRDSSESSVAIIYLCMIVSILILYRQFG